MAEALTLETDGADLAHWVIPMVLITMQLTLMLELTIIGNKKRDVLFKTSLLNQYSKVWFKQPN